MDIVALESFVTVYNYKNFTKAADKLYISQPALSRRMKALEEELGITLFKRRGTSIEGITEGGKFFYKEAVKLLKQADELRLKVNRFREGVSGTLRIAVSPDFSLSVVLKAIQKMSIEWPYIEIIPECYTDTKNLDLLRFLTDRSVDIAITSRAEVEDIPGINFDVIKENISSVLICRGHKLYGRNRLTLADLDEEPNCALYNANSLTKAEIIQWMNSMDVSVGPTVYCRSYQEIMLYLSTGKYYCLPGVLTNELLQSYSDDFRNIPLVEGQVPIGDQVMAYIEKTETVEKFLKCIKDSIDV